MEADNNSKEKGRNFHKAGEGISVVSWSKQMLSEIYKFIQDIIGEHEHSNNLSSAEVMFVTERSRAN
jgi:hypothetical protein